jgi:hypothetical protein
MVRSWVLAAAIAVDSSAMAGNEDSFLFGDQAALVGGAVVATTRNTASIWYNPAGLALNDRGRIELSGTAFTLRDRPIHSGLVLDLPSGEANERISSERVFVVPAALGVARELDRGLSIGVGLFVTEQDLFNYNRNLHLADSRFDLDLSGALTGTLIRYHAGIAIGYQVAPRIRIGASLFGVYEDYREFRKLFANATTTGAYTQVFLQRLVDAKATRLGIEAVVGAQLDVGDGWHVGLTVRSPRLVFYEDAETDNSTVLVSTGPTVPEVAETEVDHTPIGAEGTGFTHPPRFTAGAAHRFGDVDASAELDVRPSGAGASSQRAVWNVRAGALWMANQRSELGVGVFTDRSGAIPPATFSDYRVDYYGASAGWKRRNTVHLHSSEAAATLLFSTTIAIRYAVGTGESTRIRFDFRDTPTTGQVGRVADERVSVIYQELSLYIGSGFEF